MSVTDLGGNVIVTDAFLRRVQIFLLTYLLTYLGTDVATQCETVSQQ